MVNVIVDNVSMQYGNKIALKPFSAVFKAGKVNALTGASGSGKSTLLRLILGLEAPSDGTVTFVDENGTAVKPSKSVTFQENRLIPSLTVRANLKLVENPKEPFSDEYLLGFFKSFDLSFEIFKQKVSELSGGMARRISLIRAFLVPSDLILLDEPFKGLDLQTKRKVIESLTLLWNNKTVILVTHDLTELEGLEANIISLDSTH